MMSAAAFRRLAAACLLVLAGTAAAAAASTDPDWPCVQVRNPQIAATAIWGGPEIPEAAKEWWTEPDVADAVRTIASRRIPIEEAEKIIDGIAKGEGDRTLRLSKLFVGMLERVNVERNRIMAGLGRYARKQRAFADRIEKVGDQIALLKAGKTVEGVTTADLPKLEEEMKWDIRVFDERNQSLTYVCESPGLLEQRAFELARLIAERM
ncbi:hypothetical protein [Prosthecomicrobium sp. N25]|uniref:hypothetical protein n=1 Tax=Prosthecomicrobium sp. N25 TaxID=3129254 RepID=UPI00307694F7